MAADLTSAAEPRVVVVTRADCHLCAVALEVVAQVCAEEGVTYGQRDVDADADLRARFSDEVPVTFVDGAQHDFWRVDPERLRKALRRGRRRG